MNWVEVTRKEFFQKIGKLDVHPSIVGSYPYTAIWKTPSGVERGKTVDYIPEGRALVKQNIT